MSGYGIREPEVPAVSVLHAASSLARALCATSGLLRDAVVAMVKPLALVMVLGLSFGVPATTHAQSITQSVAANSDDAEEEGPTGTTPLRMWLTSSDIELVSDFGAPTAGVQKVGLRFTAMTIPAGAIITGANLTFRAVAADAPMTNSDPTSLSIRGQLVANAPTFTTTSGDISSRALTTALVSWVPTPWTTGTDYNSPSIVSVIQEIVNQGTWVSGNAIAIIITGTGHRASQAHNTAPATAAKLAVTYSLPSVSGRVFEDVNYGGGAGRSWTTASGSGGSARPAARVELFNSSGAFVTSTTTDGSGNYTFANLAAGNYTVRVVSSSVTSSRTGYVSTLRPVMTFRTNASTGTAAVVTDYVGGHDPATQDVANAAAGWSLNPTTGVFSGSGSGTAHAFAPVTLGAANVTGVDFGWNFDTIVNANNTGQGSLFGVITNANTLTGDASLSQSGRPAAIENAIFMVSNGTSAPGLRTTNNYFSGGVATISPTATSLLTISAPLVLDAQTQPGWTTAPLIELNGTSAGALRNGLTVSGGGSSIRGFAINRFTNHGIFLITAGGNTVQGNYVGTIAAGTAASANAVHGIFADNIANNLIGGITAAQRNVASGNTGYGIVLAGASATGNTISGNYVGLNAAGTAALANAIGVDVEGAATGNTIGGTSAAARNVVSGNTQMGVLLQSAGTSGNTVAGNYIGTNAAGSAALPNGTYGVNIKNNASSNTVGGTTGTSGNVISGNTGSGIAIEGAAASGNIVQGNFVGLNPAGTAAIANVSHGVLLSNAPTNTIGGTAAAARNVVSGNGGSGVYILGATASGNTVLGNFVGTNAAGTSAVANGANGVWVEAAPNNTIGGTTSAARNVISGNQTAGIRLATTTTSGNTIAGNYIGVDVSGTAALGNGSFGVIVEATNTTIGGATAASGNVIANNGQDGIAVVNVSLGNGILRNIIYSNGGLGIDLADDGVTVNNGTKSASLPNSGMDFPVFTSAVLVGTTLTVTGYVGSAASNPTFAGAQLEIFESDNDASGNGEGPSSLGFLTADASGNFSGSLTVSALAAGDRITGTATDGSNNTSEFGANFTVTAPLGGISGRVFEDANFAGTASDYDGGATDLGLANVDVEVYEAGTNAYVASTTTAAGGTYSFSGLVNGSYKLRVRAATIGDADTPPRGGLNATVPATWPYPLAAMTWGNGSALYGGQSATVDDTATGDNAGPGDDFLTVAVSGAAVANVNFGFAFNLIVNVTDDSNAGTARSTQGGLRQFIKNANAIGTAGGTTANSSQFRMQVATNQSSGGNAWWRITTPIALPAIADGGTVLNGLTQTTSGGNSNTLGPEIEIVGNAAINGINLTSAGNTVRGLAVSGYDGNSDFGAVAINGATATGNTVAGNYLGTNATGTASAVPTTYQGVAINGASGNTIGGLTAADRNVLSGNRWNGIKIQYAGATGNAVVGNYIGTNAQGTAAVPNQLGIYLWDVPNNVIGGTSAAAANVVSGNAQVGVYVFGANSAGNVIQGNTIGLDPARSAALPNVTRGVQFVSSSNNLLGGTTAGAGNVIASNGNVGVVVNGTAPTGNAILSNLIYSNTGLGIDLGANGVTVNDGLQTAGQPNLLTDAPVFTSAALLSGTLSVVGYVGVAPGQALFAGARVEIFKSDNDASGSGEGLAYLGSFTTDVNGRFGGDLAVTGLAVGERISGTATDASNNTSEFGPQFVVTAPTADLSITKIDSPDPASDAGDLLYTLLITNNGPGTATSVTVTDILPAGVSFQSATASQGSCSGTTTVTCNLGAILANGTASVEILVVTGGPGTISNTASVAATETDPVPANNTATATTQVSNQVNNDVPLTQYRRIHGFVDSAVTGGTLRTQSNNGNACLVGASSTASLSGIPATATIVNAYLYWAGSGTTVDSQVTLDGASLTADRTWQADYTLGSNTYQYFGGFEDVTAQVTAKRNGSYTFSGLTVATGAPWCTSAAVLAGWSLFVIYEDNSLTGKTLLLYDGFDLTRNGSGNYLLTGIYAAGPPEAKAVFLTWEGDETLAGANEVLKFNGTNLSDALNPVNNVYNSTINSLGVTTSYGVDLDSFNVSSLIAERDTLATAQVSTGPDLVVLNALLLQVKSNIIAGRVFEDVNYTGGAGRSFATAAAAAPGFAVGRPGARLELYDVNGNFLRATTTDANGYYGFAGLVDGNYFVRAVNGSFSSSRAGATGSEWPVQTYRVDAATGVVNPVTNEVGGASPSAQDSPANLGSANLSTLTSQSVASVRIVTGVAVPDTDFGYSFNAIVNKNNAGQGSLRQFLSNANTLGNAGLAQAGRPAAIDNAVFMLADGTARPGLKASYPNPFVGGVATITPATALPPVTDPVVLDAQTQPGWSSVPIIELAGSAAAGSGFTITAGNSTVRGFVINGFSATSSAGISISGTGANTIEGNYLGTNAAGVAAAQNYHGIFINGSNSNFIGGSAASQRNLISGNQFSGIRLQPGSSGNVMRGNLIGVNAAGTAALLNNVGVYLNEAPNNTVGGTAPGEGNVVSGNSQIGIYLVSAGASGNVIQGNSVGLNAARTAAIPNGAQGIQICCSGNGGSNNTIGGLTAAAANVVSGNGGVGVRVQAGTGNGILGNAIYGNGGIGIDLGSDGVTANDGAKPAGQPNLYMDVPVFTSAALVGSTLTVNGYVGNAPSLPLFAGARVEIFKSDGDPSGSGEGQVYLGFLTTDSSGNLSGSLTVSGLALGDRITGTATDGSNNTSEFAVFVSLGAPSITVTKSSAVLSDPINDVTNPKRIPGAVIEYSIALLNSGGGSPDAGSVLITDPIDRATLAFRVGTGVTFTDGATSSGVSLGSVTYSATPAPGPYVYNYTPVPDVDGYDGNITSFSVTTNGSLAFGGTPPPSFALKFQVKVK